MTLPVIVSTATTTGSADPIVANLPSGIVSGDLLVMMVGTASGNTDLFGGDGGQGNWTIHTAWDAITMGYALLYKIADGTEGATHSFNVSGTATFTIFVARITGANRANPLREFLHSATTSTSPQTTKIPHHILFLERVGQKKATSTHLLVLAYLVHMVLETWSAPVRQVRRR